MTLEEWTQRRNGGCDEAGHPGGDARGVDTRGVDTRGDGGEEIMERGFQRRDSREDGRNEDACEDEKNKGFWRGTEGMGIEGLGTVEMGTPEGAHKGMGTRGMGMTGRMPGMGTPGRGTPGGTLYWDASGDSIGDARENIVYGNK